MKYDDTVTKKSPSYLIEAYQLFSKTAARYAHSHVSELFCWDRPNLVTLRGLSEVDLLHVLQRGHPAYTYLALEIFSKTSYDVGVNRKDAAVKSFLDGEALCYATNQRFSRALTPHYLTSGKRADLILFQARKNLADALGSFSWDDVAPLCDFGPGANVGLKKAQSSKPNKVGLLSSTVTEGTKPLVDAFAEWCPGWARSVDGVEKTSVTEVGKLTTVPKNYKTDRTIMIEPLWNSFFQKGIGSLIKRRLSGVGIDLRDQAPNQDAARIGSLDGSYATIDLKAASDSVAKRFVEWMLPTDWFAALVRTRTPKAVLPSGEVITLQKFSSMGNAYTFELESLLFWSVCKAVSVQHGGHLKRTLVYGDDIAVDASIAKDVVEMLSYCGFEVNTRKTHIDDSGFRESCGKHYYRGSDISPFYIRDSLNTFDSLLLLANNCSRWADRVTGPFSLMRDDLVKPLWEFGLQLCTDQRRVPWIPDGFGDGGLVVDADVALASGSIMRHRSSNPRQANGFDAFVTEHYPSIRCKLRPPKKLKGEALARWKDEHASVRSRHLMACLLEMDRRGVNVTDRESPYTSDVYRLSKWRAPLLVPSHMWSSLGPWTYLR